MISETLVRSFLTLARTKNVTEAARQLYLSQQAVSKHLARLEEVKRRLKERLAGEGIPHATLEFESAAARCCDLCD